MSGHEFLRHLVEAVLFLISLLYNGGKRQIGNDAVFSYFWRRLELSHLGKKIENAKVHNWHREDNILDTAQASSIDRQL